MDPIDAERRMQYIRDLFAPEDDVLEAVRAETIEHGLPQIQIDPAEGRLLQVLLMAIGAQRVAEIGTLAGYSAIWLARALLPSGRLISLERDEERAELARLSIARAGLSDMIEVRVTRAEDGLAALSADGPFDAVFIDADKVSYPIYFDWAVENVRPGGLILAHNALYHDRVLDPSLAEEPHVAGVLRFNQQLAADERLSSTIIPIGDGIAAAVRL